MLISVLNYFKKLIHFVKITSGRNLDFCKSYKYKYKWNENNKINHSEIHFQQQHTSEIETDKPPHVIKSRKNEHNFKEQITSTNIHEMYRDVADDVTRHKK